MRHLLKRLSKRAIRFLLPRPVRRRLRSALWAYRDAKGDYGLPPAYLRVKVTGSFSAYGYFLAGERDAEIILSLLERVGVTLPTDAAILDFACGVGRILVPLQQKLPAMRFFGTDIERDLIGWCRRELSDIAQFSVNGKTPPLAYDDGQFDFVYSWSLFTHVDEELQFRWLQELQRVVRSGGVLLLTVHGQSMMSDLPPEHEFLQRGFYFNPYDTWGEYFQSYYHTAFHARAYLEREWGRFFTIIDIWERGHTGGQDIVVLRRD